MPLGLQRLEAGLVEIGVEKAFGRADRIGRIDDDEIERFGLAFLHVLDAVDEKELRARIAVRFAQLGEILLGEPRHALVDLDLRRLLDFLVLEHLAQRAAIAAADDDDALGARMREQRRVRHHLVIEEVVARRDHHAAVDDHELAPVGRVVDLDRLERRLLRVQARLDAKADRRARMFVPLGEPVVLGGVVSAAVIAASCGGTGGGADCTGST